MPAAADSTPHHIELLPAAPQQESILANLLELYAHDFSEFHDVALGPDGRFGYQQLPLYWSEPGRYPFLVKVDGGLAGLALVKRGPKLSEQEAVYDVAEFFIARAYRRRGIGMQVAHQMWRTFPGPWEVRVMQSNHAALHFWRRAIAIFNGEAVIPSRFEKDGQNWHVFAFESRRPA